MSKDFDDPRDRLTLEALADIDLGLVVDHEVVEAWAESLTSDKPLALKSSPPAKSPS
jgi:hypothetical protein